MHVYVTVSRLRSRDLWLVVRPPSESVKLGRVNFGSWIIEGLCRSDVEAFVGSVVEASVPSRRVSAMADLGDILGVLGRWRCSTDPKRVAVI